MPHTKTAGRKNARQRKRRRGGPRWKGIAAVAAAATLMAARQSRADQIYWQGGIADWFIPINWIDFSQMVDGTYLDQVPGPADDAYINNGFGPTISAGDAMANSEWVGYGGIGVLNQSGGTNTIGGSSLYIGVFDGGTGTYVLGGTGSLTVDNDEFLGLADGAGVFNQSGGINTISSGGNLQLGANSNSTGTYILSGTGSVSIDNEYVGEIGPGFFDQTGGTNTVNFALNVANTVGSAGNYNLNAGTLSASSEDVGYMGVGAFNQSGGANTIIAQALTLGTNVGATGTYVLSNGTLNAAGEDAVGTSEYVGYYGAGVFTQTGGTNTTASDLDVGYFSSFTNIYTLGGPGTLSVGGNLNVGYFGTGEFNQSDGSNTVAGSVYLGVTGASTAVFTLSGTGSLSVSNGEYVGVGGTGNFNQSGGVNLLSGGNSSLFVGFNPGSTGTYTLGGSGALTVTNDGGEIVGDEGAGIFNQTGGTNIINGPDSGQLILATLPGSSGTYALSGNGSLSVSTSEFVGLGASGIFNQIGGSNTIPLELDLGTYSGAAGVYLLSGSGTLTALMEVVGDGGTGTFTQTGGLNVIGGVAGNLFLGGSPSGSGGTGTYTLSGTGLLKVSGGAGEFVGYQGAGIFNQTGGTNTLTGAGVLTVGSGFGASGNYWLSGNGTLSVGADEYVGYEGPGTFNQSGGSNTVGTSLYVGSFSTGSYILSNTAMLAAKNEYIGGDGGAATFNQSGGLNLAESNLTIDYGASYTLSGAGEVVGEVDEYVGYFNSATFNQTGGTNFIGGGSFLYLGYFNGGTGTYNLSGSGTLTSGTEYVGYDGAGNFNQSGGSSSNILTGYPGIIVGYDSLGHSTASYVFSAGTLSSQYEAVGYDRRASSIRPAARIPLPP